MSTQQISLATFAANIAILPNVSFVFSTAGSTTSTVPSGYTKAYVEAIGAGGQGFGSATAAQRSGGGGGGYARTNALTVAAESTIYILVANTSIASASNSWVNISSNTAPTSTAQGCLAVGGLSGASAVAGLGGGQTGNAGQLGTQTYAGATGQVGNNSNGGGAAGRDGAAAVQTAGTDTSGITALAMGGGTGGTYNTSAGTAPGGGGPGAATAVTFDGSIGRVRITYVQ